MKKYLNNINNKLLGVTPRDKVGLFNVGFNVGVNVGFNVGVNVAAHPLSVGKRFYHSSKFHWFINRLYKANQGRRFTPVPFEEKPIDGFNDLRDKLAVRTFFKKFIRKGGIYRFSFTNKPNIFYIGSTGNFYTRFRQHTKPDAIIYNYDWFHYIGKHCGWDKFRFEILEVIEDLKTLRDRENFFLRKYYPLLNTRYKSAIVIHRKAKPSSKDGESSDHSKK